MIIAKCFLCSGEDLNLYSSFKVTCKNFKYYCVICPLVPLLSLTVSCFVFLEKLNIRFVPAEARAGLITAQEKIRLAKLHEENKHFLRIPRRQVEQM